ncbi:MAG: hypothetical protein FWG41_05125 [Methanomassiliicoccaceae archaeon]|nr:hypothetical protein [Methanomassiliicoccaceae archaeon]
MATLEELTKRVEALEKENAELRAMMDSTIKSTISPKMATVAPPSAGASITNEAVADMLGGFIDNFNSRAVNNNSPVGYMMSEVELDLKTVVVMKENGTLLLKPADETSPAQSVAPLKLSVRAVPGQNTVSPRK